MSSAIAGWVAALANLLQGLVTSFEYAGITPPWRTQAVDTPAQSPFTTPLMDNPSLVHSLSSEVEVLRGLVQIQGERIEALEQRFNGTLNLTARLTIPPSSAPPPS